MSSIGKYTVFPEGHYKRMFPTKSFGRYEESEMGLTNTYGIMCREQGLRITNELHRIMTPAERNINRNEIAFELSNKEVKEEIIKDELSFAALFQEFSGSLIDFVNCEGPERQERRYFFTHPGIFDGVINVLVQELRRKAIRPHLMFEETRQAIISQVYDQIRAAVQNRQVRDFKEIIDELKLIKLNLDPSLFPQEVRTTHFSGKEAIQYYLYLEGYHKFCKHLWRPSDIRRVTLKGFRGNNSGMVLWGERGCGKSQI